MSTFILTEIIIVVSLVYARAHIAQEETKDNSQQICYTVQPQGFNPEQVSGYLVYPPYPVFKPVNTKQPTESSPVTTESKCKWKRVFKAVSGNGRDVYVDWTQGSLENDNENVPEARELQSEEVFRASSIINTWNKRDIDRVRIEVFKEGEQMAWFLFNGVASDINSWMSQDRLIASSYEDIKTGNLNYCATNGDGPASRKRRFYISRLHKGCRDDCGYLLVSSALSSYRCGYEGAEKAPAIYYSLNPRCGRWNNEGQRGSGDRLVVSVRDCEIDTTSG